MINIKPVSDLRNKYQDIENIVLQEDENVYLTKNGYGAMVLISLEKYTKMVDKLQNNKENKGKEKNVNYEILDEISKEEELEYLKKSFNGDNKAKDKLIEHNLRLVVFLAKKYENTGYDIEDLVSIGSIGLIKGINTYKIDLMKY